MLTKEIWWTNVTLFIHVVLSITRVIIWPLLYALVWSVAKIESLKNRNSYNALAITNNLIYDLRQTHTALHGTDSKCSLPTWSQGHDFMATSDGNVYVFSNSLTKTKIFLNSFNSKRLFLRVVLSNEKIGHHTHLEEKTISYSFCQLNLLGSDCVRACVRANDARNYTQ